MDPAYRHAVGAALDAARRSLCIMLLAVPGATALAAGETDCAEDVPPADIRVLAEHAFPHVDYVRSSHDIRQQLHSGPHTVALGMTQASTTLSVEALIKGVHTGDGSALCARPQIDVTLRHSHLAVSLAREIEHDECVSSLVLAHELKHVEIERDTLDWAAQQLQSQLQAYYQARVLRGSDAQIRAGLVRDFEERWTPVLDTLLQSSGALHAEHDENDSYGDGEACGGELYRTAQRLR